MRNVAYLTRNLALDDEHAAPEEHQENGTGRSMPVAPANHGAIWCAYLGAGDALDQHPWEDPWQSDLACFFAGSLGAQGLLSKASDSASADEGRIRVMEANAYIGLRAEMDERLEDAVPAYEAALDVELAHPHLELPWARQRLEVLSAR